MRVLYVIPRISIGGIQKLVIQWASALSLKGIHCDILALSDKIEDIQLENANIGLYAIDIRLINPISASEKLNDFFEGQETYDAVHANVSFLGGLVCRVAKKHNANTVTVCHAHLSNANPYSSRLSYFVNNYLHLYYKYLIMKYSDFNLACSYQSGDYLFGKNSKYVFFPNAINVENYRFSKKVRDEYRNQYNFNDKFVIINVARFSQEKNQKFLIDIFTYLFTKKSDAVLVLVGDGELYQSVYEYCNEINGINDKVFFLGNRNDIGELFSMADVFVLPSFLEGFPLTLVEAQASGLPSIVSEAVPTEAKLTNLVEFCHSSDVAENWANLIVAAKTHCERTEYAQQVKNSGFDKDDIIDKLINYYGLKM